MCISTTIAQEDLRIAMSDNVVLIMNNMTLFLFVDVTWDLEILYIITLLGSCIEIGLSCISRAYDRNF